MKVSARIIFNIEKFTSLEKFNHFCFRGNFDITKYVHFRAKITGLEVVVAWLPGVETGWCIWAATARTVLVKGRRRLLCCD